MFFFSGNGYLWKGFYAESLTEALSRGYKSKLNDMSDVSSYKLLGVFEWAFRTSGFIA